jgi:hypothetical protein
MLRGIGLEQYSGFQKPFGAASSPADRCLQMAALNLVQFDYVILYRDFLGGHGEILFRLLQPLRPSGLRIIESDSLVPGEALSPH